jgi:hypothetical protein
VKAATLSNANVAMNKVFAVKLPGFKLFIVSTLKPKSALAN